MRKNLFNLCGHDTTKRTSLSRFIRAKQLTDSLDWIEKNLGIAGDSAIIVLAAATKGVRP